MKTLVKQHQAVQSQDSWFFIAGMFMIVTFFYGCSGESKADYSDQNESVSQWAKEQHLKGSEISYASSQKSNYYVEISESVEPDMLFELWMIHDFSVAKVDDEYYSVEQWMVADEVWIIDEIAEHYDELPNLEPWMYKPAFWSIAYDPYVEHEYEDVVELEKWMLSIDVIDHHLFPAPLPIAFSS